MQKAVLLIPSEEAVDRSLDARAYIERLSRRLDVTRRHYDALEEQPIEGQALHSVGVLAALSSLELESGYMEMEFDTIFGPQALFEKLRSALAERFPLIAVVDDAYSDYLLSTYLKAGATAVVSTAGVLFGIVTSRMESWEQIFPYINAFTRV
ncbi:MAG: hypothetical protein ACYS1C_06275 [Planctomycetota bacterium]|jgi:hypothetical protein